MRVKPIRRRPRGRDAGTLASLCLTPFVTPTRKGRGKTLPPNRNSRRDSRGLTNRRTGTTDLPGSIDRPHHHCAESPDPGKTALGSTRGDRPEHRGKLHGILRCIDADGGIFSHIAGDRVPVLQDPELFQFLDLLKSPQREPGKLRQ